jgi:hypothetical protein
VKFVTAEDIDQGMRLCSAIDLQKRFVGCPRCIIVANQDGLIGLVEALMCYMRGHISPSVRAYERVTEAA